MLFKTSLVGFNLLCALNCRCSYFGLEANSNVVAAKSETNWAVIIPIMLSYPNIWPKITDIGVWKEILKQGKVVLAEQVLMTLFFT